MDDNKNDTNQPSWRNGAVFSSFTLLPKRDIRFMMRWSIWLPLLLLWGVAACASLPEQLFDASQSAATDEPTPAGPPPPAVEVTPTPAPVTDKIAFSAARSDGEKPDIYLMNSDGTGLARLTDDPGYDTSPSWSLDRRQIAFVSDKSGVNQLYLMDIDGSNQEVLTAQPEGASVPAWSPNGSQIAFVSNRALGSDGRRSRLPSPSYALYIFDLETRETRLVTGKGGVDIHYPGWKPRP